MVLVTISYVAILTWVGNYSPAKRLFKIIVEHLIS